MPLGKKMCPKCAALVPAAKRHCECGYEWPKREGRKPRTPSASLREIESDEPEFAAGITTDGRLMLVWPRQGETLTLTRDECELVFRALAAWQTAEEPRA